MKHRLGRFLTVALAASVISLCTSCSLWPWGGKYRMEIQPVTGVESQLQSLYIIVSQAPEVAEPLKTPANYHMLVEEDRILKYTHFVQYELEGGTWNQVYTGRNQSEYVTIKVKDDVINVAVKHKLIKKSGNIEYKAIVLAFFGSDGFQVSQVDHLKLNTKSDQILQVSTGNLNLIDD